MYPSVCVESVEKLGEFLDLKLSVMKILTRLFLYSSFQPSILDTNTTRKSQLGLSGSNLFLIKRHSFVFILIFLENCPFLSDNKIFSRISIIIQLKFEIRQSMVYLSRRRRL